MKRKITVIVPCFNEKKTILKIIKKINLIRIKKQIILVDDFSTDGTRKIIKYYLKDKVNKIIFHKKNLGKGACIISAKPFIKNDIVIIQDADLEYDPRDYINLIEPILKKKTKVVYGSRFLNKSRFLKNKSFISDFRVFGNYFLTKLSNLVNSQYLTDAHTCYKVFTKELFDKIKLKESGFSFCPEITTKIGNIGEKILEVPIRYKGRSAAEGKKIKFKDAIFALITLIKYKIIK